MYFNTFNTYLIIYLNLFTFINNKKGRRLSRESDPRKPKYTILIVLSVLKSYPRKQPLSQVRNSLPSVRR